MLSHKKIRQKGKLGLSKVFSEMAIGDKVALVNNLSFRRAFPERFHGRTGVIVGMQGRAVVVCIKDGGKVKKFMAQKIHLKKLSS
jgi:ribosomal protein L21E